MENFARTGKIRMEKGYKSIDHDIEKQLDRLLDTESGAVAKALEKRISKLEDQKRILGEKLLSTGRLVKPFEQMCRTALNFIKKPNKIWGLGGFVGNRTVLKLVFLERITWERKGVYRTPNLSLPFKYLGDFLAEAEPDHALKAPCIGAFYFEIKIKPPIRKVPFILGVKIMNIESSKAPEKRNEEHAEADEYQMPLDCYAVELTVEFLPNMHLQTDVSLEFDDEKIARESLAYIQQKYPDAKLSGRKLLHLDADTLNRLDQARKRTDAIRKNTGHRFFISHH